MDYEIDVIANETAPDQAELEPRANDADCERVALEYLAHVSKPVSAHFTLQQKNLFVCWVAVER
eukprot:6491209-Amphidinium_carterae.1